MDLLSLTPIVAGAAVGIFTQITVMLLRRFAPTQPARLGMELDPAAFVDAVAERPQLINGSVLNPRTDSR